MQKTQSYESVMIKKMTEFVGSIFILVAPSGGGKSSLIKAACSTLENLEVTVSHTTRKPRVGEQEGVHYHFVENQQFKEMIAKNEVVEHARVFDDLYGTSVQTINNKIARGTDLILDLDWQGAKQMSQSFAQVSTIFILPPSTESLLARLKSRGQDNDEVIDRRMEKAIAEMSHYQESDYLIVNDVFEKALQQLIHIIQAERLKQVKQAIKYRKLLSNLLKDQ
jgi:guanylate kinase